MTDDPVGASQHFRFDPTINMGHLITAGTFVIIAAGGLYLGDYRLSELEKQVTELKGVVIENARLGERFSDLSRRVDRIETWREGIGAPRTPQWTPP